MGPPRATHKKSRNGCLECKQRHTKCPEQRPRCDNCVRFDRTCTWNRPFLKKLQKSGSDKIDVELEPSSASPSAPHSSASPSTPQTQTDDLPLQDLKLLHHYTATVYSVLDTRTDPKLQRVWQDTVVQIAFQHPFLLRGILAISALHLAYQTPGGRESFLLQSSQHLEPSLQAFKTLIANPVDTSAPPLFACASLLVVHSFGISTLHEPNDPIEEIFGCIQLIRGVSTILRKSWDTIHGVEFSALASLITNGLTSGVSGDVPEINALKQQVESLPQYDTPSSERTACLEALGHLERVLLEVQACGQEKSAIAMLFNWPALLSDEFVSMLAQRQQVALVILAHFAIPLGSVGQCWWLQNSDLRLIDSVEQKLDERYRAWLVWPMKHRELRQKEAEIGRKQSDNLGETKHTD